MSDGSSFFELNGSYQAFVEAFRGFINAVLTELFTFLTYLFYDITPNGFF